MDDPKLRELQANIERLQARLAEMEGRPAAPLRRLLARLPSSKPARFALMAAVFTVAAVSYAATISVPYTFVNGTVADADEVNANFSALVSESNAQDSRLAALEATVTTLQSQVTTNTSDITALEPVVIANTSDIAANATDIATNQMNIATNTTNIANNQTNIATNTTGVVALNTTFADVSRGGTPDTLTFSGMNVQVVDGSGWTWGTPTGLGNLIVGYNENTAIPSAPRTGSHNLVVGVQHGYSSYGGIVSGSDNTISGAYTSVCGGNGNTASASYSSAIGPVPSLTITGP